MDENFKGELDEAPQRSEDLPPDRQDRIKSIIEFRRRGMTNEVIAKVLKVGIATIYRDSQILKQLAVSRATNLDIKEEIGDTLNFLDEIADKAMEGFRSSIEDNEQIVYELTKSGEKRAVTKTVPDHSQAQRYLATAVTAKKQKVDTILQVSTTHALNKVLLSKANETELSDVAKLRTPEDFNAYKNQIDAKIYDVGRKLHYYNGPNPRDYRGDRDRYNRDLEIHMEKYDQYIEMQKKLLAPWPSENRK